MFSSLRFSTQDDAARPPSRGRKKALFASLPVQGREETALKQKTAFPQERRIFYTPFRLPTMV